jgi:hypothetical protein
MKLSEEIETAIKVIARENAHKVMVIIAECDTIVHTDERPFCSDWECSCHGDVEAVNAVTGYFMDGLLTWFEVNLILRGATI